MQFKTFWTPQETLRSPSVPSWLRAWKMHKNYLRICTKNIEETRQSEDGDNVGNQSNDVVPHIVKVQLYVRE